MDRLFKCKKLLWLKLICGFAFCLGCSSERYYPQAVAACFPDGIPQKIPMSNQCKTYLEGLVSFGSGFDESTAEQKQQILEVFYFMLSYPLYFPLDQSVYGIAPANQIISQDLRIMHEENPEQPINELFFDYLMNQVRILRFTKEDKPYGAFYLPLDQSINLANFNLTTFADFVDLAGTLNHESRHSRYWDHPIFCPELFTAANACDEGSNQPYGWEFSFYWALLQGHQKSPLSEAEIQAIGCKLYKTTEHIYGFPDNWQPIRGPVYNERTFKNYPTLQQIASRENLTLPQERDFYQEIIPFCPTNELVMSDICKSKLSQIVPISVSPNNKFEPEQKEALLKALHAFLIYPVNFSTNMNLFQTIPPTDFQPQAIFDLLRKYPNQSPNQVFFNYTLSAIQKVVLGEYQEPDNRTYYDFCNRTFFFKSKPAPCPYCAFDLLAKLIESARQSEVWPSEPTYCRDKTEGMRSYCEKGTDGPYGFSINYLWALLQGMPPSGMPIDVANYIYKQICYKTYVLVDVPPSLAPLKSMNCESVNYFIDNWDQFNLSTTINSSSSK